MSDNNTPQYNCYHSWNISPQEAIAIQDQMRYMVIQEDALGSVHKIAGVDVGFVQRGKITRAAVVLLDIENLTLLDSASAEQPTAFPYVPGLLSFREAPAILEAIRKLSAPPDLIMCDGHGLAHPRRFGIACHLGVILDIPTIGVAKRRLTGEYCPVPDIRGAWQALRDGDEIIGAVLRTRKGVKPVFVSVGHRICLQTAIDHILQFTPKYRLPEPIRLAHQRASGTWMRR